MKTSLKTSRKMAHRKLMAAIEMLKPFVFLSMYGLMTHTRTRNAASMMTSATACTVPWLCAKAMNRPLISV